MNEHGERSCDDRKLPQGVCTTLRRSVATSWKRLSREYRGALIRHIAVYKVHLSASFFNRLASYPAFAGRR